MSRQPNILLLFTDQQRYDTIAAMGYDHMITPNLDRLVKEGCAFSHAYSPNPICQPARYNIITGLPGKYHGNLENNPCTFNRSLPVLPQILADSGYQTRAIGKMHFAPPRRHHGFDRMELMEEIPRWREDDDYAMYLKSVGLGNIQNIHGVRNLLYMLPQRSQIPEEHHGSTWVADRSIEFLKENAGRRPFFLWSSWIAPHPPFDVPDEYADLYSNRELPETFKSETRICARAKSSSKHCDIPKGKEKSYIRRIRELYYGAITQVDKNIGRVLDALEEIGELDNTLIIFTSDHGEMLGDHNAFQKFMPYDSCCRIPFIVRYPVKVSPETVRNDFVDLNDILPTFLDVANIEYPGPFKLPGYSIFKNGKDRRIQYTEGGIAANRWISLQNERYKYNYHYGEKYEELFDMQNDPCESVNLLISKPDDPEIVVVRNNLRERLYDYEKKWGLEGYAENGKFKDVPELRLNQTKNMQFPFFPENITDPKELASLNVFEDEVLAVVEKENLVNLQELDLDSWNCDGIFNKFVSKIRSEESK